MMTAVVFEVGNRVKCIRAYLNLYRQVAVGDEGTVLEIDPYNLADCLLVEWDTVSNVKSTVPTNYVVKLNGDADEPAYSVVGEPNPFDNDFFTKEGSDRIWEITFGNKYNKE